MDTLLSIFISLNIAVSPGTYTTGEISLLASIYGPEITTIENNPILLNQAVSQFYEEAEDITILDGPAW